MTDTAVEDCSSTGTASSVPVIAALAVSIADPQVEERPFRDPKQLRRDLRSSTGDATSHGVMIGTGETYLPAFVLAVGLGEIVAGLTASIPQLAGGIMQLISPRAIQYLGSHRRWVVLCASAQALSFVPLVIAAVSGTISAGVVLAVATIYWGAGLATGPAWNTWMGTVIPHRIRPGYFARRTRLQQAAVLSGFLIGGVAIHFGTDSGEPLKGFALLFALAGMCRAVPAACLARTSEPAPLPPDMKRLTLSDLLRRSRRGGESQRLLYLSLVQGAAYFAGPYFAPYMFRVLNLSYAEYVVLISTAYVAKVASLSLFGRFASRFGVRRLLWVGGIGIVPVAAFWLISERFWYLILVQLAAGVGWAAYELAVSLIYFTSIRPEERTSVLTLFNLSTTASMVVGSLLGGAVLEIFGATRPVYYALFAGSSLLRLGTLFFLRRIPARLIEPDAGRPRKPRVRNSAMTRDRDAATEFGQRAPTADGWIEPALEPLRQPA